MGCGASKSANFESAQFFVTNESNEVLTVHVAQRITPQVSNRFLTIDSALAARSLVKADTPAEKAVAVLTAVKTNTNNDENQSELTTSDFVWIRETFANVGTGKTLAYNLPYGKYAEIFVTITTAVPQGEDKTAVFLCHDYSPPSGTRILIDQGMNLGLKPSKKFASY